MNILSIETSCDDTAVAVIGDGPTIKAAFLASQIPIHKKYGGVVPEVASRKHLENLIPTLIHTLQKSEHKSSQNLKELMGNIDAIAVTTKPGLIGSLLVGTTSAKTLAWLCDKPLIGVDHIQAHIFANFLEDENRHSDPERNEASRRGRIPMRSFVAPLLRMTINFPAIALVISGGHTELTYLKNLNNFEILGKTRDDAAGEAFDKVAKLLGYSYPGGPEIERLAKNGKINIKLPIAMAKDKSFDFSFSGLKTAVLYYFRDNPKVNRNDLCASFQGAVIKSLLVKSGQAAAKFKPKSFLLAGGVAANQSLKSEFKRFFEKNFPKIKLFVPKKELCTDNAAMVGAKAYFDLRNLGSSVWARSSRDRCQTRRVDLLKNRRKKWYDVNVGI